MVVVFRSRSHRLAVAAICFRSLCAFFRNVLPGNVSAVADNPNFIPNFIAYFFGAGMCEEGLEGHTPVLIALALTLRHGIAPSGATPGFRDILNRKPGGPEIFSALALRGPLDGMLMGFAAGAAFIVDETLGEYVPNQIERVFGKFAIGHCRALLVQPASNC